ncbi:MAG: hypothetical protein GXP04_10910 [Alphaproteobacteria bacterium]|nr:hypothetical protein [Alphaproteobacteria bacterium]
MDQRILIVVVLGVVALVALALVVLAPTQKDKANKRVASLKMTKAGRRSASTGSTDAQNKERRRKLQDSLEALDDKTKDLKKKKQISLEQSLEQAGLPLGRKEFYIASAIVALGFTVMGLISGQEYWITGLLTVIGGLGLPRWIVGFLTSEKIRV